MNIVDKGVQEARRRRARQEATDRYQRDAARRHCVSRFLFDFYNDRYIPETVPSYDPTNKTGRRSTGNMIEDPENPFPEVEFLVGNGGYQETSLIRCEGLTYRVTWEFHGGGDRAYWDDGWWPEWQLSVKRRFRRARWVKVYGAEQVARALGAA